MRTAPRFALLVVSLGLYACGGGGGGSDGGGSNQPFQVRRTNQAVGFTTPLAVSGRRIAYLASETGTGQGGTDWNGDMDIADSIVVVVDAKKRTQRNLRVAADTSVPPAGTLAWTGSVLFIVVSENEDGRSWNGDPDRDDRVLLYWMPGFAEPVFVDELAAGTLAMVAVGEQLFYASDEAPAAVGDTNLRVVTSADPTAIEPVATALVDPGMDGILVSLAGVQSGLVALLLDENGEGELNGDGDATDTSVLALLDGTTQAALVVNVALAVDPAGPLWRARAGAAGDWLVAFLVDETDQGANLNDPSLFPPGIWQPPQCFGLDDPDTDDQVLHWLDFAAFAAGMAPVVNTGLVGSSLPGTGAIAIANDHVGTISRESDEGDPLAMPPGCDLNGDGDTDDLVFRWTQADAAAVPDVESSRIHAVTSPLPGGANGVLGMGVLFVIQVDEAADGRDLDGDLLLTKDLIGARNPANAGLWNFDHGTFVGGTWMARDERQPNDRFLLAFSEAILGADLNGDGDLADSVPTFPERSGGLDLDFPGVSAAVSATNAGIQTGGGFAFYRVSEASDGMTDHNGDGDATDQVLERVNLNSGQATLMGTLNTLVRPAVAVAPSGAVVAAAFLAREAAQGPAGTDFNGDGDTNDWVVSYFEL